MNRFEFLASLMVAEQNVFLKKRIILSGNLIVNDKNEVLLLYRLPIDGLEKYPISPDLKLLLSRLKRYFKGPKRNL